MKEENMRKSRRAFGKMVLAAGAGLTMPWEPGAFAAERPLGRGPSGIKIGTRLDPQASEEDLSFFSRLGIEYATIWTGIENANYAYFSAMRRKLESRGIQVWNIGILDLH